MAEHGLAVLRLEVLAVDQRRRRLPELRPEQGAPILVTGRAIIAAMMATNSADDSRPLRLHSRTMSPSL